MLTTEWDWKEVLGVAHEEAWEDGHEEGLEFTAYNALLEGASNEFVQKITGLDVNTIEAIRAKLQQP